MPSSYSSNLLLELMADGENEGLWGDITNTNLEILGRAVSGVTTVTLSGTTHTLTVSQGALSEGHYSVLELGGSPTGTVTVTIDPNTVARIYVVKNSSGEDAIFTQGSGDNVTVANGETKVLYSDGAGASAAVTLVTNTFTDAEQSKLSNIDQGVATTDSPEFAGLTVDTDTLFVDASADSVGINNASPSSSLDVTGDAKVSGDLTVDTDTLYVDSSNNRVGIGTSSPSAALDVQTTDTFVSEFTSTNVSEKAEIGIRSDGGVGNNTRGRIIGGHQSGGSGFGGYLAFNTTSTSNTNSEAMRIDSSGDLLVGKTTGSVTVQGFAVQPSGQTKITQDGADVLRLNRLTSDGTLIDLRKDNSTLGSIATHANAVIGINFRVTTDKSGLRGAASSIIPWYEGSDRDNDRNEKQQIASLTDAEMTAAKTISTLFKTFKWNSAVDEKGDAARTHTGVIAQEVEQAMTDAGLDAGDYAFFISSTWWETETEVPAVEADPENNVEAKDAYTRTDTYETQEEAPEGATERTRKGIRYPELLSFVGAATEQRLASIETRLTSLEA